ncbi:MAG: HAD hydrolase family protein [Candidatus Pacebacteria bacterium]|nr:HAD hydrolase family protein [Candidatus Paceibacterota bacterium]
MSSLPISASEAAELIHTKKIVAFDLDGTLAESKQSLSPEMGILISQLLQRTDVVIITGGTFSQIQKQCIPYLPKDLFENHIEMEDDDQTTSARLKLNSLYLLPTSGSQRYEYNIEQKLWLLTDSVPFPNDQKEKVMNVLKEYEKICVTSGDLPLETYGSRIEERGTQITLSALGQDAPIELKKVWDPDVQKRHVIQKYLENLLPDVDVHIGGSTSIDILPKGFTKATGLKRLISQKNIDIQDMVFVGDAVFPGGNDYSAFEAGIYTIPVKDPQDTKSLIQHWVQ